MNGQKIRVFMTGGTGTMGSAGRKEIMKYPDKYELTLLARDNKRNRKKLIEFENKGGKVIWGDLLDKNAIRTGVESADIVLHVGGMVSPMAEHYPEKTLKVNVGSMALIADVVKEIEAVDKNREVKVVYIGSVSQYGNHLPPHHWGKVGDKLRSAKFDAYAVSKILAERALVEAGLKKWVSIRQTGILHPGILMKANDPVAFHVPLNGVLEWISIGDSGRILERVCREDVPNEFWNNFYNAGGGEKMRLTNLEFERGIMKATGCPPPEKVFETNWFALDNFHGIWFEDSDYLEELLHFRNNETFEDVLNKIKQELPFYFKLAPLAPASVIKVLMKSVARKPDLGPLGWIENNDQDRIKAAWGSLKIHSEIKDWNEFEEYQPERRRVKKFRPIDAGSTVAEETLCERGHRYLSSEALKAGGHGCPECLCMEAGVSMVSKLELE